MGAQPVVDVHAHVLVPAAGEAVAAVYGDEVRRAREPYDRYMGADSAAHNRDVVFPHIRPKLVDPDVRLGDMDRMGIDVQVLAPFVGHYFYWTEPDLGARVARLQNDHLAALVREHPDRFAAVGTVPLQDPQRAVAELDRAVGQLGLAGVQISGNVDGRDLDDPRFEPFFARAAELGAVVVLHPNGVPGADRFADYYLVNVLGNPLDSTIALSRLIFAGVLERHPGLRLCVVHGGGFLPFYSARLDHAYEVRPECRAHISAPPSRYLQQIHFDTVVFDPALVARLVEEVGASQVLLGTDYPFDMGDDDPLGLLAECAGGRDAADAIAGGNARRLFGFA